LLIAYGRIHMSKLKLDILNSGGQIFYSDTDSIVTDQKLPDSLVSSNEIGKLKLEHKITKAIFIADKLYWLANDKGEQIVKAKGVKSDSLHYPGFIKLYFNQSINTPPVKKGSCINWSLVEVKIMDKNVTLTSTGYTKRTKLYLYCFWDDTKPLYINDIDKSLIPYKDMFSLVEYKKDSYTMFIKNMIIYNKYTIDEYNNNLNIHLKDSIRNTSIIKDSIRYSSTIDNITIYSLLGKLLLTVLYCFIIVLLALPQFSHLEEYLNNDGLGVYTSNDDYYYLNNF
jgi:hypothetical protein